MVYIYPRGVELLSLEHSYAFLLLPGTKRAYIPYYLKKLIFQLSIFTDISTV